MTAVKVRFDGEKIEVPAELKATSPRDVLVVFDAQPASATGRPTSVWDVFGAAERQRTAEDIVRQVRADRDDWGDR